MVQLSFREKYTRIPHELIDNVFAKQSFPPYEMRILLVIMRLTWGWSQRGEYISYRALAGRTRINLRHVVRAIKSLEGKHILLTRKGRKKTWMEISLDYTTWRLSEKESLFTRDSAEEEAAAKEHIAEFRARLGW